MTEEEDQPRVSREINRETNTGEKIVYKVSEKIGQGGFAAVYSAIEIPGERPVAIKCTSKSKFSNPKIKKKLISEIEIHRDLHHKNIVQFRAVFQDKNFVYFLLELCTGGNVFQLLKNRKSFDEKFTATICRQILEAMVYIHKKGIIHRDLKLQNFLIDESGTVKLADFGLSVNMENIDPSVKPSICGTPGYISPEVISQREKHTPAIDVWALGVCAFLMLTGKQPFHSNDRKETYNKIRHIAYSWPSAPVVSATARDFVESVFRRNPAERPTAENLLQHPFILQLHPPPVEQSPPVPRSMSYQVPRERAGDADDPLPTMMPSYAVRIWWDYSSKYGLAYLLHNGACGACFNDSSRIILSSDGSFVQYWNSPHSTEMEVVYIEDINKSPLKKKLLLVQHFSMDLKQRVNDLSQEEIVYRRDDPATHEELRHVKYWARTKDGILFRMANKDVQANFKDHTKVVIESGTRKLFYSSGSGVQEMDLTELRDREKHSDIRKRVALIKIMAKELI